MPEAALHLEPGCRFERYELLAPFATGGMASIWLGRIRGKHGFERLVAIKTMLPEHAAENEFHKMLIDEARIASGIRHTNVAEIFDVGDENGVLFIVMEWVDGDSLLTIHRALSKMGEKLPLPILLRLTADACRGLHAAHGLRDKSGELLGVVHRDVSPHNILVGADGVAKVIDFGVAKARERLAGQTESGHLKGKVRYMAPEQALGQPVDRRADIWAMGAVLQFLMTGRTPYAASNDLATLHMIATEEPPAPLPFDVPASVVEVVKRALALRPDQRFPTAEEMAGALEAALLGLTTPTSVSEVTKFMSTKLSALGERRQKAVATAVAAAEERERSSIPVTASGAGEQTGVRPVRRRAPLVLAILVLGILGAMMAWRSWQRPATTFRPESPSVDAPKGVATVAAIATSAAEPPSAPSSAPSSIAPAPSAKKRVPVRRSAPSASTAPSATGRLIGF